MPIEIHENSENHIIPNKNHANHYNSKTKLNNNENYENHIIP